MLTIREFSNRTGVAYRTVQAWIAEGRFTDVKRSDDGRVLLPESALGEVRRRKRGRKTTPASAKTGSPVHGDTALYVRIPDESHHAEGVADVVRCASRCRAEGWGIEGNPYADCGTVGGAHRAMDAMLGNEAVRRIVTPGMSHLTGGDPAVAFILDRLLKARGIMVVTLDGDGEDDGTGADDPATSSKQEEPATIKATANDGSRPATSDAGTTSDAPRNNEDHSRRSSSSSSPATVWNNADHSREPLGGSPDGDGHAPIHTKEHGDPGSAQAFIAPVHVDDGQPVIDDGPDDGDDAGWDYGYDDPATEHDPWWDELMR